MNQYSIWKYLVILIIVMVGVVYALPNLYGEDPALQITSSRGFELPADLTTNIDDALLVEQISFSSREQQGNRLLVPVQEHRRPDQGGRCGAQRHWVTSTWSRSISLMPRPMVCVQSVVSR